jgi:hypothetical protein
LHVSTVVQALPSSQGFSAEAVKTQPLEGEQESLVQGLLSLHTVAVPGLHAPSAHVSPVVQALPSEQSPPLGENVHPVSLEQASAVHGSPSSHSTVMTPTQTP